MRTQRFPLYCKHATTLYNALLVSRCSLPRVAKSRRQSASAARSHAFLPLDSHAFPRSPVCQAEAFLSLLYVISCTHSCNISCTQTTRRRALCGLCAQLVRCHRRSSGVSRRDPSARTTYEYILNNEVCNAYKIRVQSTVQCCTLSSSPSVPSGLLSLRVYLSPIRAHMCCYATTRTARNEQSTQRVHTSRLKEYWTQCTRRVYGYLK